MDFETVAQTEAEAVDVEGGEEEAILVGFNNAP